MKYLFFTLFGLIYVINLEAQISLSTFFDTGANNVSEEVYFRNSTFATYYFGKMNVEGGIRMDIKSASEKVFTGSTLSIERQFLIKTFPLDVKLHTIYNPYSNSLYEFNWGILAKTQLKHFGFKLGTSFRTYSLTQTAKKDTDSNSNHKINENWNLMYFVQYLIKPIDYSWNAGVAVTNIDYFLINQETNPMININGKYRFSESLSVFAEAWYKAAGFSNISVNYFGFFIRTGLVWDIKLST